MIDALFQLGNEIVLIRVEGNKVLFGNTMFGSQMADIKGLKLDYVGVCRQFPDLEMKDDWREETIKRFKEKVKSFKTERQKIDYLIEDLSKHGYKALKIQRKGFRPENIGGNK